VSDVHLTILNEQERQFLLVILKIFQSMSMTPDDDELADDLDRELDEVFGIPDGRGFSSVDEEEEKEIYRTYVEPTIESLARKLKGEETTS